jgi:hypothetical protein
VIITTAGWGPGVSTRVNVPASVNVAVLEEDLFLSVGKRLLGLAFFGCCLARLEPKSAAHAQLGEGTPDAVAVDGAGPGHSLR